MLPHLKPTDAAIEKLALAEADPAQHSRFRPIRWGRAGNLLLIIAAGSLGLLHAALAACWRGAFPRQRDGSP